MFQCGKVASGNLDNFVQKFIAMLVLTCWKFFLLENTPSGILCKSYGFYNCITVEISAWSGCHAACSSHAGVVCIACCSYGSYFCIRNMVLISVFFNQLCISFLKKQENSLWIRNLLKINSHLAAAGCMSVVQEFAKSSLFSLWDLWLGFTYRSHARSLCKRKCM